MSVIIKSNVAYSGGGSLPSVNALTLSATDVYNAYAARVVADGGTVQSPTACQAAITKALAGSYLYRSVVAVSANWGIKTSGGNITKMYNLAGTIDGIITGTVALDTTTAAVPLAVFPSGVPKLDFAGISLLVNDAMAVAERSYDVSSGAKTSFTAGVVPWAFWVHTPDRVDVNGVTGIFAASPDYGNASLDAAGYMAEMSAQRMSGFNNGVTKKVMTNTFPAVTPGTTGTLEYVNGNGSNIRMAELWYVNDASQAVCMSLTGDMATR